MQLFRLLVLLFVSLITHSSFAAYPSSIDFAGTTHHKAYQASNDFSSVIEYIPEGQNLDNWQSMIAIWHYHKVNDPAMFAQSLGFQVNHESGQSYDIIYLDNNPNDVILPFVLIEKTPQGMVAEVNIWRFKKCNNHQGIVAIQYAVRQYGANLSTGFTVKFDMDNLIFGLRNLPIGAY